MCQCGCGDTNIEKAFRLPDGTVIGYQLYRGCRECFQGLGMSLALFDEKGSREWVPEWVKKEPITPDEFGGNRGKGIAFGLFEVQDLRAAAKSLNAQREIADDYDGDLDDWLHDNGLQFIQEAVRKFQSRLLAEEKKRQSKK